MDKIINIKDFALSVVSGNPATGDTPEEISKNALNLYFSAITVAEDYNESVKPQKKDNSETYNALKGLGL